VQQTGGSYQDVVNAGKPEPTPKSKKNADTDTDDSDSDSDTSSYDSAEGGGSNPEKQRAAVSSKAAGDAPVDQSTNVFAKEAPGIKQNTSKAAVNVQNPSGWETLASSDTPTQAVTAATPQLTRQDAIPDDLWSEFEAAAQKKQELEQSRQEDKKLAEAEKAKAEAEKKAAEIAARAAAEAEVEAKRRAEEEAKEAEVKAREEARAKARAELQNTEQTVDLEEQRLAMKQFGGDGMGAMTSEEIMALKGGESA
jgi:hypothetical protein